MFKVILGSFLGAGLSKWATEKQIPQKALALAVEVTDTALTNVGKLAVVLQAKQRAAQQQNQE